MISPGSHGIKLLAVDLGVHSYPAAEAGSVQLLGDGRDDTSRRIEFVTTCNSSGDQSPQLINCRVGMCFPQVEETGDPDFIFGTEICQIQQEVLVFAFPDTIVRQL